MKNLDLVYIAAPYYHKDRMIMNLRHEIINKSCSKIILQHGCSIFSPISHTHTLKNTLYKKDSRFKTRKYFMDIDLKILKNCSNMFVLMLDGWKESRGILEEIKFCKDNNIEISFIGMTTLFNTDDLSSIQQSVIDSEIRLDVFQHVVGNWAQETFKGCSPNSILAHLGDEIKELKSANNTLQTGLYMDSRDEYIKEGKNNLLEVSMEAADVLLLLLHYCHTTGIDLGKAGVDKFRINQKRKWSDKKNDGGYFSHIE